MTNLADAGFLGIEAHALLHRNKTDAYVTVGKGYPL